MYGLNKEADMLIGTIFKIAGTILNTGTNLVAGGIMVTGTALNKSKDAIERRIEKQEREDKENACK